MSDWKKQAQDAWNAPGWKEAAKEYHETHGHYAKVHEERGKANGNGQTSTDGKPAAPSLRRIDLARYDSEPIPAREWGVPERFPRRAVCLLSGEGGRGKSITLLQLAAAHVLGKDWLRSLPEAGPVVLVNAEDEEGEIVRRLKPIVEHYGASFADLARDLHIFSLAGADPLLALPDRSGRIVTTPLYAELRTLVRDVLPICIIIDNVADVFGANEIERSHVRQFIAVMRQLAIAGNGYVIMSSHPSLTGLSNKTGLSGSTQWHNAVRARAWLHGGEATDGEAPDPDLRVLEFLKSNYSKLAETIMLRWQNGLYVPVAQQSALDKAAAEAADDQAFLSLLDRFTRLGENVSNKARAGNYAPTMFVSEPEAKGKRLNKAALQAAMRRLFAAEQLTLEPYGPPSQVSNRIIRKQVPGSQFEADRRPVANGFRVLGECASETNCVYCGKGYNVRRIAAVGRPGLKSETLHEECAEAWFAAI